MKKPNIGILMGGRSIEQEVSFVSGRTLCDHIDTSHYTVIPLFQTPDNTLYLLPWRFLHRGKISDFEHRLSTEAEHIQWSELKERVDFVWIALHGRYGEDGAIQGFFELLKIPYFGSGVLASALGMNKILQKKYLQSAGITVPHDCIVTPSQLKAYKKNPSSLLKTVQEYNLSFPLIVKPAHEGSSLGVSVVFRESELITALEKGCYATQGIEQPVLIEERIEGMEFTCVIIDDPEKEKPLFLPLTEVLYEEGFHLHGYEQKYMPGRSIKFTPARCSESNTTKIYETCLKVTKTLGFTTLSRIDGFLKKDGSIVIIDPNSLCGMAPSGFFFTQAAHVGMSHCDIINYLLSLELKRHGMKKHLTTFIQEQNKKQKIRVGVLLGGPSNEKEISLESGRNICYKLSPHTYTVIPLFLDSKNELYPLTHKELVCNATAEIEYKIDRSTKLTWEELPHLVDFVFIALHGAPGENGIIQGTLEFLGLPYNGSGIATSALCIDKYKTTTFLRSQGFDVPQSWLIENTYFKQKDNHQEISSLFTDKLPLIVKPHDDGCSVMVQKATTEQELFSALEAIFTTGKKIAMVEEYITGMELTVGVIGNEKPQALPPSQAIAHHGILSIEEKFLPGAGENQTPAPLSEQASSFVRKKIEAAFKTLECSGYARIDCFYQDSEQSPTGQERLIILEVNSLPGMTPATCIFHQAAEIGIKPMDFINLIITLGFQKHLKNTPIGPLYHQIEPLLHSDSFQEEY